MLGLAAAFGKEDLHLQIRKARLSAHILAVAGVDIVTFGQYLQPTPKHLAVKEMVTPEKFEHWRKYGEDVIGFR